MPAQRPIGVLLITGGMSHQENFGPGFQADPRCTIVGLTDESEVDQRRNSLNQQLAKEMGIPFLPDLDDALARPEVGVVSVCSEFERRAKVATRCAEAGKHVYIDKPLATRVEDAERLVSAVQRSAVRSQMATHVGQPFAQRAKEAVESGALGELRAMHFDLLFAKGYAGSAPLGTPRQEHYPPSRFTFPDAKREMWTTAVYSLALARWLAERREFESVYATTANYFFQEHHSADVEDFAALSVTMDGGVTITVTAGRIGWRSHRASGPNFIRLFGTKGNVWIDAHEPRFEVASEQADWSPPPRDPQDPMGFWRNTQQRSGASPKPYWYAPPVVPAKSDQSMFVDSIELQQDAQVTIADGAKIVEVLLAAYESSATGKVIRTGQ